MKKLVFFTAFLFILVSQGFSQQVISSSSGSNNPFLGQYSNEVKINFANLLALGSFEGGYERFLSESHSLDFQLLINDRFGFNAENDGKKFKTNSVQTGLNFYFGKGTSGRFYIYPFVKIRFGELEESTAPGAVSTTDLTSFILGAGAGYKWEVSNHFAFGPYLSLGRGFSEIAANRFTAIELNGGFSLGYRF